MKKHSGWIIFQIIQLIIFLMFAIFLATRTYDGHGTYQTPEAIFCSLGVWALFCAMLLAMEWLVYWLVRKVL